MNVGCLSRPVLSATIIDDEKSPDNNVKSLDPWEDGCLLYFLSQGKFEHGISKKQIKRVTNRAKNFRLESDKLVYFDPKSKKALEWPKDEFRRDIIINAHEIGHWSFSSSFNF